MSDWLIRFFNFRNNGRVKLRNRPLYAYRVLAAGAAAVVVCAAIPPLRTREWTIGLLGVVAGIGYFLFQQHLNESKFFAELFEKFNARYDGMSEKLQGLRESENPLAPTEKLLVIKYFNLCAEEFLFYRAGYIDETVWQAWCRGMAHYGEDSRFADIWRDEGGAELYYGFEFPIAGDSRTHAGPNVA
jgi:hypothetical protein